MKNIALKRLTDEELKALREFMSGKKEITFIEVDNFMMEQNKKHGLFDNCYATVCKSNFVIQRPIGW